MRPLISQGEKSFLDLPKITTARTIANMQTTTIIPRSGSRAATRGIGAVVLGQERFAMPAFFNPEARLSTNSGNLT